MREYDMRQDGTAPSDQTLRQLTTPGALRARAAVRMQIAEQDAKANDTWAFHRNQHVAADMLARATQGDGP